MVLCRFFFQERNEHIGLAFAEEASVDLPSYIQEFLITFLMYLVSACLEIKMFSFNFQEPFLIVVGQITESYIVEVNAVVLLAIYAGLHQSKVLNIIKVLQ